MQYVLCTSLEKSPQTNPIIGRIECKAGHGAGRPTQKMVSFKSLSALSFCGVDISCLLEHLTLYFRTLQIDEAADRYAFMAKMLDASWVD